jgi:hypothetical protein
LRLSPKQCFKSCELCLAAATKLPSQLACPRGATTPIEGGRREAALNGSIVLLSEVQSFSGIFQFLGSSLACYQSVDMIDF